MFNTSGIKSTDIHEIVLNFFYRFDVLWDSYFNKYRSEEWALNTVPATLSRPMLNNVQPYN